MRLPLGSTDWSRTVAGEPDIAIINRYFESDPSNTEDQVALLSRPGLIKWLTLPTVPVRNVYSQPGTFSEALFAVGGNTVYKIDQDETVTSLGTLSTSTGFVSIAITDTYAFFADGGTLHYYTEDDFARGTLTITGAIAAGQTVTIGTSVYKFASDITLDADGTASFPWLVTVGLTAADSLQSLFDAIGGTGTAGTTYSELLAPNEDVAPESVTDTVLVVHAINHGTAGNSLATTETLANGSWGAATLAGGGGSGFHAITAPDSDGIISVGSIANFVICVVAQGFDRNGRFYWIEPGEISIDPLNFATAERAPDPVWNVVIVGDQFWLPGSSTLEAWYPNGDPLAPFLRQQGRLFEQGVWEGTVVPLKEYTFLVGNDGMPYLVTDRPTPIGTPGIVQRIREAIDAQRSA